MADFSNRSVVENFIREVLTGSEGAAGKVYKLSFAEKGQSGASFGLFQNDIAANSTARNTFRDILLHYEINGARVFSDAKVEIIITAAAQKGVTQADFKANIEGTETRNQVNQALDSAYGHTHIDAQDNIALQTATNYTVSLLSTLNSSTAVYGPGCLTYINPDPVTLGAAVAWINMTGAPNLLTDYLAGKAVTFNGQTRQLHAAPQRDNMHFYLQNMDYFRTKNPNFSTWWAMRSSEGNHTDYALGELKQGHSWSDTGTFLSQPASTTPTNPTIFDLSTDTTTLNPEIWGHHTYLAVFSVAS